MRAEGTLEALERRSSLLSAAEALEKRAERIQEWPFDEGVFARVVAISSTVVAAILARLLLAIRSGSKTATQVVRSWLTVRTTFPVFCPVSTYLFASTTSSNG